jgi:DNA-binding MarR family transcriptional regulator
MFNGDIVELHWLSLTDWRIIKYVYKQPLSLQEIQEETKYPYHTVRYHCDNLHKWGLLEKKKSACCIYSAPSSKDLQEQVMNRYYDIMEV